MAKKGGRELIRLVSTAGTGYFYTTSKNKKRTPDKLVFKKYDPVVRKHVDLLLRMAYSRRNLMQVAQPEGFP